MLITFPHMGTLAVVLEELFTGLGRSVLPAPSISKRTLELGSKYSPETVCLPFKVTLGNFIEALELGADTIVTCGGVGPCRLGYYAEVQKGILERLGYRFTMLTVEPAVMDAVKKLFLVAYGKNIFQIYQAFHRAGAKMNALDAIEKKLHEIRPREAVAGQADAIWQQAVVSVRLASEISSIQKVKEHLLGQLAGIPLRNDYQPLRVGLVGEIYVMLEAFINQHLEQQLGSMGVEVYKTMYLSDYVRAHLLRKRSYLEQYQALFELAKPYLGHYVGGHGLKSIARTVEMGRNGFDGMVQVYPFTCMPEVIAKNILPRVSRDVDIPVLTLAYDEQSGEAGMLTRLEAFVDLLKYRRRKQVDAG